jgi:deoxyribonuclease V
MIAAIDVFYNDSARTGSGAAVVFEQWDDAEPLAEFTATFRDVEPYVPGQFFERELPCLLDLLEKVREPLDVIIVDGFVCLGDKPGLGMYLWESLERKVPVIGVAKNSFRYASPVEVLRGSSKWPLFVTAVGVDVSSAAESIHKSHGANRIPTLLKRVDRLTKMAGTMAAERLKCSFSSLGTATRTKSATRLRPADAALSPRTASHPTLASN